MKINVVWTALAAFDVDGVDYPAGEYRGEIETAPGVATRETGALPSTAVISLPDGRCVDAAPLVRAEKLVRILD